MALTVLSPAPVNLLVSIKLAIRTGAVRAWLVFSKGGTDYFTHATDFRELAYLVPTVLSDRLLFHLAKPTALAPHPDLFGLYHGRFVEMLQSHFADRFTTVTASAGPIIGDLRLSHP